MVIIECNVLRSCREPLIGIFLQLVSLLPSDRCSKRRSFTQGMFSVDTFQILSGLGLGILLASLAGFIPAYKAYSLKVVDALAKG